MMSSLKTSGVSPDSTRMMKLSVATGVGRKIWRLMTIDEVGSKPPLLM